MRAYRDHFDMAVVQDEKLEAQSRNLIPHHIYILYISRETVCHRINKTSITYVIERPLQTTSERIYMSCKFSKQI